MQQIQQVELTSFDFGEYIDQKSKEMDDNEAERLKYLYRLYSQIIDRFFEDFSNNLSIKTNLPEFLARTVGYSPKSILTNSSTSSKLNYLLNQLIPEGCTLKEGRIYEVARKNQLEKRRLIAGYWQNYISDFDSIESFVVQDIYPVHIQVVSNPFVDFSSPLLYFTSHERPALNSRRLVSFRNSQVYEYINAKFEPLSTNTHKSFLDNIKQLQKFQNSYTIEGTLTPTKEMIFNYLVLCMYLRRDPMWFENSVTFIIYDALSDKPEKTPVKPSFSQLSPIYLTTEQAEKIKLIPES